MRKRGKRIKQTLTVRPLGMKSELFEYQARASLVVLAAGQTNKDHLVNLYVLAEMGARLDGDARHIATHAATVKRLCDEIFAADYRCNTLQYRAMEASCDVLIRHLYTAKNHDLARHALAAMREVENGATLAPLVSRGIMEGAQ